MQRLLDRQDTFRGSVWAPWTQNLYTYVGNNPTNYIDPTGHSPMTWVRKKWQQAGERVGCVFLAGYGDCKDGKALADGATSLATKLYGPQGTNGVGDAFRHAYWSALMQVYLSSGDSAQIASAHEYWGTQNPDIDAYGGKSGKWYQWQTTMDSYNNAYGRSVGDGCGKDQDCIQSVVQEAAKNGKLLTILGDPSDKDANWTWKWSDGADVIWIDGKPYRPEEVQTSPGSAQ